MKKIIAGIIITVSIVSCSSIKNYSKTELNKSYLKGKTIVFTLSSKSDSILVKKIGPSITLIKPENPDNRLIFRESVEDLAKEVKLNLQYSDTIGANTDSIVYIATSIDSIQWHFTFTNSTMETSVKYNDLSTNKNYPIKGKFKNYSGGRRQKHLYRSLKNANFQLLESLGK